MTMRLVGVVETVIEYIREQIITGELAPGQKLNEIQLAAKFNISRPPLREAFRTLEKELLLVSVPRRGSFVSEISVENLREVYEARLMIEEHALERLKTGKITFIPEVVSIFSRISELGRIEWELLSKEERVKYLRMLADFHTKLIEASGNKLFIHFFRTITYLTSRYQYKFPYGPETFSMSQESHHQIIKEIQAGEFEKAKITLKEHNQTFVEILEKKMLEEDLSYKKSMERRRVGGV
jgi:DNA-binding GntR family transcriptional regulator